MYMKGNTNNNRPKGITLLAALTMIAALIALPELFNEEGHIIVFGALLKGIAFKLFYSFSLTINFTLAIGIYKLRNWAYYGFLCYNGFFLILFLINIFLINKEVLMLAGWKDAEGLVTNFRSLTCIFIFIITTLIFWIYRYRQYFCK